MVGPMIFSLIKGVGEGDIDGMKSLDVEGVEDVL